jgi:hypothetical protein
MSLFKKIGKAIFKSKPGGTMFGNIIRGVEDNVTSAVTGGALKFHLPAPGENTKGATISTVNPMASQINAPSSAASVATQKKLGMQALGHWIKTHW